MFYETILNIFRGYLPNKYITRDDKEPVWTNENIKSKIKSKNYSINNTYRMAEKKIILQPLKIWQLNIIVSQFHQGIVLREPWKKVE